MVKFPLLLWRGCLVIFDSVGCRAPKSLPTPSGLFPSPKEASEISSGVGEDWKGMDEKENLLCILIGLLNVPFYILENWRSPTTDKGVEIFCSWAMIRHRLPVEILRSTADFLLNHETWEGCCSTLEGPDGNAASLTLCI